MIRGIVKRRQNSERSNSRMQMAIAFIAGIVITAAMAQTPVAADIFSPKLSHDSVVPALPDAPDPLKPSVSPDTANPSKPCLSELVYTLSARVVSPC